VGSGGAAGFAWGDCSKPDGARTAPHGGGFLLGSPWDRWLGGRFFFKVSHFIKKNFELTLDTTDETRFGLWGCLVAPAKV
jgi:hypothetical protein